MLIVLKAIIMLPGLNKPRNCVSELLYIWIPIYEGCFLIFDSLEYELIWNTDPACACHVKRSIGIIIPMHYANSFVVMCFVSVTSHFPAESCDALTQIRQGYVTTGGKIVLLNPAPAVWLHHQAKHVCKMRPCMWNKEDRHRMLHYSLYDVSVSIGP